MKLSLPERVGHPGIETAGLLSIFSLSRLCERESRGSADNHTWIDASRTRETRCAYPRGHALIRNHCAMPCRQSNPDEPRISYAITRISPSNVPMIRAEGSNTVKIAPFFLVKKKYRSTTWIRWWKKKNKKKTERQSTENRVSSLSRAQRSVNLTFKFHAPISRRIFVSKSADDNTARRRNGNLSWYDSRQCLRIRDSLKASIR